MSSSWQSEAAYLPARFLVGTNKGVRYFQINLSLSGKTHSLSLYPSIFNVYRQRLDSLVCVCVCVRHDASVYPSAVTIDRLGGVDICCNRVQWRRTVSKVWKNPTRSVKTYLATSVESFQVSKRLCVTLDRALLGGCYIQQQSSNTTKLFGLVSSCRLALDDRLWPSKSSRAEPSRAELRTEVPSS